MDFSWQEVRDGLRWLIKTIPEHTPAIDRLKKFIRRIPKNDWEKDWEVETLRNYNLRQILEQIISEQRHILSEVTHLSRVTGISYHHFEIKNKAGKIRASSSSNSRIKALAEVVLNAWGDKSGF